MRTLKFKTIGAAKELATEVEIEAKRLADDINEELSGYPAKALQIEALTQDFVDRHEIKARFHSGIFLGFKFSEEAEDEFSTFKKK